MTLISQAAHDLVAMARIEAEHHNLGHYWGNHVPVGSYSYWHGDKPNDAEVERKKRALKKSWPELVTMLEALDKSTPRR